MHQFQDKLAQIDLPPVEVLDKLLSKAKLQVFYKKGAAFLSSIICNTEFVWSEDIPTAATDGTKIYWNPRFFYSIPTPERVFVIVHEVWHIAFQHCLRLNGRDPKIHNIAADYVINNKLLAETYSVSKLGFDIYSDNKYHDWSVDRVYEDLMKNPPPTGGSGQTPEPEGNGAGSLAQDIIEASSGDEMEMIRNIVQAVQASKLAGEAGVIPGEVEEAIEAFLNPILPWEQIVQQFLTERSNDDYSYRRPSRRYDDLILPTLTNDGALQEMNWYIDVSGSISDAMLLRFFSEMKYIKETFNPAKINIIQFDTRITKVTELEPDTEFDKLIVYGRGGTDISPVRGHIVKTVPAAAVIFSDMECEPINEVVGVPVLWCIFKNKHGRFYGHIPSWGQVIDVKEN